MRTGTIKQWLLGAAVMLLCIGMHAQEGKRAERRAHIESERTSFINEQAELSEAEAKAYWELRQEVNEKKKALAKEAKKLKELESASEEEIKAALEERQRLHIEADQIELDHLDQFIEIVSAHKLLAIKKAEKEFKRSMLKDLRQRARPGEFRRGAPDGR